MSKVVILTNQQEKKLVKIFRKGQEKSAIAKDRKAARDAKTMLIELNQFLVGSVASKYPTPRKSFNTLFKAGNKGLLEALKRYNPEKKYKFSTYATWWIRAAIHEKLGLPKNPESH